jgi:hypothetical protein
MRRARPIGCRSGPPLATKINPLYNSMSGCAERRGLPVLPGPAHPCRPHPALARPCRAAGAWSARACLCSCGAALLKRRLGLCPRAAIILPCTTPARRRAAWAARLVQAAGLQGRRRSLHPGAAARGGPRAWPAAPADFCGHSTHASRQRRAPPSCTVHSQAAALIGGAGRAGAGLAWAALGAGRPLSRASSMHQACSRATEAGGRGGEHRHSFLSSQRAATAWEGPWPHTREREREGMGFFAAERGSRFLMAGPHATNRQSPGGRRLERSR